MKTIPQMMEEFGGSAKESRDAVIKAHGGKDSLARLGVAWAAHHKIVSLSGSMLDLVVAYATAVEVGYRIGRNKK